MSSTPLFESPIETALKRIQLPDTTVYDATGDIQLQLIYEINPPSIYAVVHNPWSFGMLSNQQDTVRFTLVRADTKAIPDAYGLLMRDRIEFALTLAASINGQLLAQGSETRFESVEFREGSNTSVTRSVPKSVFEQAVRGQPLVTIAASTIAANS